MREYVSRTVSDLVIVQNGAATGRPAHDVNVGRANLLDVVESGRWLMPAEGECRTRPRVDAENGFPGPRRARLQGAVARHVLGAGTRLREEKAPAGVTSPRVHRVLNCHLYEHHNQARRTGDSTR